MLQCIEHKVSWTQKGAQTLYKIPKEGIVAVKTVLTNDEEKG